MKICIFGADGRTGVEVVQAALKAGHEVIAFVYNQKSANMFPSEVVVKVGDIMNYEKVLDAITGSNTIISVVGHISGSDPLMQTKGIANIVKAMKEQGISRILSLTGTGAREDYDSPSLLDKILNFFIKFVDPERINDGVQHVRVLKESGLDWTVLRVLKLTNSSAEITNYELNDGGPVEWTTSRKKVAKILVDLISNNSYIKKLPVVIR